MLLVVAIVPLLMSMLLLLIFKKDSSLIKPVALMGSFTPLLFSYLVVGTWNMIGTVQSFAWFSLNGLPFNITAELLPINFLLFVLVSIIGPLVVIYSMGFMDVASEDRRFYLELLAFQAAMLIFSISGGFLLLFLAWEFLSVTSYLLIGFWNQRENALRAARETITIIFAGDIALIASMIILALTYQSFDFTQIITAIGTQGVNGVAYIAFLLLILAIMTKSAQFPFQEWLSAAMEGPTPVSAFLHSSTMVKAGVFLALLLFPLFRSAGMLNLIAAIGALTAVVGIVNAIQSNHVKRILAYSTIEELGLMLFAIGIGAYSAALYFFFAQTFYKALLFFYAGALMKTNGTEDIRFMRNAMHNKLLFLSALFGVLALAGFLPFDGFFANVGLEGYAVNTIAYPFLLLVDIGVSVMIFRWFIAPLKRGVNVPVSNKLDIAYERLSAWLILPPILLAMLVVATSYMVAYVTQLSGSMSSYGYIVGAGVQVGNFDQIAESAAVVLGALLAYLVFRPRKHMPIVGVEVPKNYGVAGFFALLYVYTANFVYYAASVVEMLDLFVNDIFDGLARYFYRLGFVVRMIQTGSANDYALVFVVAALILIVFVVVL